MSIGASTKQGFSLIVNIVVFKRSQCSCEVNNGLMISAKYYMYTENQNTKKLLLTYH